MSEIFSRIEAVIQARQQSANPDSSYVAALLNAGTDRILKKIGEEATEVVIAAKGEGPEPCVHEIADLWFHLMVLMAHKEIALTTVETELERRFGTSGLEEKTARPKNKPA